MQSHVIPEGRVAREDLPEVTVGAEQREECIQLSPRSVHSDITSMYQLEIREPRDLYNAHTFPPLLFGRVSPGTG